MLEDFPDDEPAGTPSDMPLACPVSFAAQVAELDAEEELLNAFQAEVEGLRNWYDVAVEKRGRTTADTTGLDPKEVAAFIAAFARGEEPDNPMSEVSLGTALKINAFSIHSTLYPDK